MAQPRTPGTNTGISSLMHASQISLGRSSQARRLIEEQNSNSRTPEWQDPIRDALQQETKFSRVEGVGN